MALKKDDMKAIRDLVHEAIQLNNETLLKEVNQGLDEMTEELIQAIKDGKSKTKGAKEDKEPQAQQDGKGKSKSKDMDKNEPEGT